MSAPSPRPTIDPQAPEPARPAPDRRAGGRWLTALLLLVAVLLGLVLARQVQQTRRLAAEIEVLEASLSAARIEIVAHRQRMSEVRSRVGALRGQIEDLEALISPGPEGPAPARIPPTP